MTLTTTTGATLSDEIAWFISVPKQAGFTQPPFHFGERVKWWISVEGVQHWLTGQIRGGWFDDEEHSWEYCIKLDSHQNIGVELEEVVFLWESELKKVEDSLPTASFPQHKSDWLMTCEAAKILGISPVQLRKLRLKGLFQSGHHYRDTSVPGSGKPRWQWHVERCALALEVPPEKRLMTSSALTNA